VGCFVDGIGEIDAEGVAVVVAVVCFLHAREIVDLAQVGTIGRTSVDAVVFGELCLVERLHC
jgi:hypothetical protein